MLPPLLITTGEPSGVGPELALAAAQTHCLERGVVLVGDFDYLESLNQRLSFGLDLVKVLPNAPAHTVLSNTVLVLHVSGLADVVLGHPNVKNAPYVLSTLDSALHAVESGWAAGIVTCPVHKGIINQAGIAFTGHTEYLAQACCVDEVVMLLADAKPGGFKVALATTHLPLRQVPQAITIAGLQRTLAIIAQDFKRYFAKPRPNIWVAGLNPHAGEGGYLGDEEITTIEPAIVQAQLDGLWVSGPYPADTLFCHRDIAQADVILAMYHDQGLPVLKYSSFGHAVNVTLGLPIIRTSVDHGTAFDLAGTKRADPGSLLAAIKLADHMAYCKENNTDEC